MSKVLFVSAESGDWEGMYVDGELKCEGHSLQCTEILKALGIKYERRELPDEVVEEMCGFPSKVSAAILEGRLI